MTAFNVPPREIGALQQSIPMVQAIGPNRYTMCSNEAVHCLATDPSLYAQLEVRWAICPDHVVFLGAVAGCVDDINTIATLHFKSDPPPFLFVRGLGVLQSDKVSAAQQAQLAFYRDLLVRTDPVVKLAVLTQSDIVGLLNWDAEKYRIALNQTKSGA
jgi:rhamnose utilization protein RhaD (predicted bifunctional aldolase and dehydrogenase)